MYLKTIVTFLMRLSFHSTMIGARWGGKGRSVIFCVLIVRSQASFTTGFFKCLSQHVLGILQAWTVDDKKEEKTQRTSSSASKSVSTLNSSSHFFQIEMKHCLQINHCIQKIETHLESNSFNLYYAQNVGQIDSQKFLSSWLHNHSDVSIPGVTKSPWRPAVDGRKKNTNKSICSSHQKTYKKSTLWDVNQMSNI